MTEITGVVKWFDTTKGFGFVAPDVGSQDVLLRGSVLRNFGHVSVAEDTRITVRVDTSERGHHATEILSIEPPADMKPIFDLAPYQDQIESLPLTPARVKWFDKSKGFGFVNLFGEKEDVFVHVEVLRNFGMLELEQGQAISVKVVDGERGRMVAEVRSWDHASA